MNPEAILIAGPTASGKTVLAIDLAKVHNGVIINADSMQVYDVLSILTARPNQDEMQGIEHLLFGHVHPGEAYSSAKWIEEVRDVLEKVRERRKLPIFVGGTGLYFKALTEGLSSVPPIDPAIREKWRKLSEIMKVEKLHEMLHEMDSEGASVLHNTDMQRIVRALEVVDSTGFSLAQWQSKDSKVPLTDSEKCLKIVLNPPREILAERIGNRFQGMVNEGSIDEVRALLALDLSPDMPAMRAIGVPQLAEYLHGKITLDEAIELATIATRQYAKRQRTWFRNQFDQSWSVTENPGEAKLLALVEN